MDNYQKVALVSGGRTSGYMLRMLLDKYPNYRDEFITCFCNTGKEMPQTLDFVHEMETRWQVPFVWLEYHRVPAASLPPDIFPTKRRNDNLRKAAEKGEHTHWFRQVTYETASRKGEPFDELLNKMNVLPNVVQRACSAELKMRTSHRFLFSVGVKQFTPIIGIRKDEEHRAIQILATCDHFAHPIFPMVENNVQEHDVLAFWKKSDFDLRLQSYQGNCDFCFLKAKWKRIQMAREHPELIQWWIDWETKRDDGKHLDGKYFRKDQPYLLIRELSKVIETQEFCFTYDKDIPCSCAEKAFAPEEDS